MNKISETNFEKTEAGLNKKATSFRETDASVKGAATSSKISEASLKKPEIIFRKATKDDIAFLSHILVCASIASKVSVSLADLPKRPDIYQYVEDFPKDKDTYTDTDKDKDKDTDKDTDKNTDKNTDIGIIAQTKDGTLVGAAWLRLLPSGTHNINEPLPELTMGVIPQYRRTGVGKHLLERLYKEAANIGLHKISLGVHKDNTPAIKLYKQQNWVEDGYFKDYIMMSKSIDE